jgi:hypothetical protein
MGDVQAEKRYSPPCEFTSQFWIHFRLIRWTL